MKNETRCPQCVLENNLGNCDRNNCSNHFNESMLDKSAMPQETPKDLIEESIQEILEVFTKILKGDEPLPLKLFPLQLLVREKLLAVQRAERERIKYEHRSKELTDLQEIIRTDDSLDKESRHKMIAFIEGMK